MSYWADIQGFLHQWSDAWVLLTAVGTLALAGTTFCSIRQNQNQINEGKQQHRDNLKPICLLAPYGGVDPWNQRGQLVETLSPTPENPSYGTVAIHCILQNIGNGPALRLRLMFRFLDMDGFTTNPWELAPLAAGEKYGSPTAPLLIPFWIHENFTADSFSFLVGKPWEIWLEYQDITGAKFQSIFSKSAFDMNLENAKLIDSKLGGNPKAAMRQLPWFTYVEEKRP